jgi:hypothetical protein
MYSDDPRFSNNMVGLFQGHGELASKQSFTDSCCAD